MIVLILALGLVLRLINLNQSFWLDEAISGLAAKNYSFIGIITKFAQGDTHPPLYYLVLRLWSLVFGYSEISMRLLSVLLGVATIFVIYKISVTLFKNKSKFLYTAPLLLATSGLHIYYSQEVRMYTLSTLLVSLTVYFFLKKDWVKFSIALLFLGMTDYLPLLVLPAIWIYFILSKKYEAKKFISSHIPLVLFFVIWFPSFLVQMQGTKVYLAAFQAWRQVLGSAGLKDFVLVWIKFIIGRISFELKVFYALIIILPSAPILFLLSKSFTKFKKYSLIWFWLLVPLILFFIGSIFIPGFSYFRLLFIIPAFYILISSGINKSKFSELAFFLVVSLNLFFSAVYIQNQQFWREDWRGAVAFVESQIKPNEIVLMSFPEPFAPYRWYSKEKEFAFGTTDYSLINKSGLYTFDYLMDLTDHERKLYIKLEKEGFKPLEVYDFRGIGQVRHWERP